MAETEIEEKANDEEYAERQDSVAYHELFVTVDTFVVHKKGS